MDRIDKLCSYLSKCTTFADVACDHGYIAQYMLKNGLCRKAVVSDISSKCLKKAETLLKEYISACKCRAVCCDGLKDIDRDTELVVIAGIGGEEIIKILEEGFIPRRFLFQPMKNVLSLRKYLIEKGCGLDTDDIFTDGKNYYFVIGGSCSGKTEYDGEQLRYGKDCLNNSVFYAYLRQDAAKKKNYLKSDMRAESRSALLKEIEQMEEVLKGEVKRNIQ